jgi:hypothetical protein
LIRGSVLEIDTQREDSIESVEPWSHIAAVEGSADRADCFAEAAMNGRLYGQRAVSR